MCHHKGSHLVAKMLKVGTQRATTQTRETNKTTRSINHLITSTHYSTLTATCAHLLSMRTRWCNDKDYSKIPIKATIQNKHTTLSTMQGQQKVTELRQHLSTLTHHICLRIRSVKSPGVHWGPLYKEFMTSDLQRNVMGQSTEMSPLVSMLFGHLMENFNILDSLLYK